MGLFLSEDKFNTFHGTHELSRLEAFVLLVCIYLWSEKINA
jgi:hypothetical protein